jgi:hypothetical protein
MSLPCGVVPTRSQYSFALATAVQTKVTLGPGSTDPGGGFVIWDMSAAASGAGDRATSETAKQASKIDTIPARRPIGFT